VALLDVIIPAGGEIDEAFARVVGVKNKALIAIDGEPVISRTIAALRASGLVDRIVVVTSKDLVDHAVFKRADIVLPEGKSGPENIFRALDELLKSKNPPERVMIVTSDLPFLTEDCIKHFVDMCPRDKDFCVPLIEQGDFLETFPSAEATFVKLKGGIYTTGCMYLATAKGLQTAIHHIEQVFQRRKSKLGMARLLGFGFILKLLTRSLTVEMVEQKVSTILGCRGVAVPNSPPELAYDIDYVEDYQYAIGAAKSARRSPVVPAP
jgi:GTP:adenosylcobinamide-phosphate guanylyltransferase